MNERQPMNGGLQIPQNVGLGQTIEQQTHSQWDTHDAVVREIGMRGLMPTEMPENQCPVVTAEMLTTADSTLYTTKYAELLSWYTYTSDMLAIVTSQLLQTTNEMDMIEARMRNQFREDMKNGSVKMSAKEIEDVIEVDPRHAELRLWKQKYQQYKTIIGTHAENIERSLKVVSRQVEIRKLEVEQNRTNIPGRDYTPRRSFGG